jgi:UDPglucose 6-dehydrogenase
MKPGMGDAGACHPRDNIALSWLAQEYDLRYDVFATIMEAREQQARHIASRLFDLHLSTGLPVYIHGKSYKPGVEYTNGSYSLLIESYLRIDVTYIDPLTEPSVPASVKGIVLMAHHAPTTYSHSYAIGANTQAFYTAIEPGSIVVDPWRYLSEEDVPGCRLIRYGNTRRTS